MKQNSKTPEGPAVHRGPSRWQYLSNFGLLLCELCVSVSLCPLCPRRNIPIEFHLFQKNEWLIQILCRKILQKMNITSYLEKWASQGRHLEVQTGENKNMEIRIK